MLFATQMQWALLAFPTGAAVFNFMTAPPASFPEWPLQAVVVGAELHFS